MFRNLPSKQDLPQTDSEVTQSRLRLTTASALRITATGRRSQKHSATCSLFTVHKLRRSPLTATPATSLCYEEELLHRPNQVISRLNPENCRLSCQAHTQHANNLTTIRAGGRETAAKLPFWHLVADPAVLCESCPHKTTHAGKSL